MSSPQMEEVRRKSEAILSRAETDETFRQQLRDDPEGTLLAEGMPDDAIGDFVSQAGLGEVAGYLMGCTVSCVITAPTAVRCVAR